LGESGAPVLLKLAYLGMIEPLSGFARLIAGRGALAGQAQADLLVVNMCGLLRGPGRRLKRALIAAVQPDLLVAVGGGRDLEAVLADQPAVPAIALARSPLARRKGEGERRALRRAAFRNYFEPTPVRVVPANGVCLHSEKGEARPPLGRLVALMDEAGDDLALGLVIRSDLPHSLVLRAPLPAGCRLALGQPWP
jgi:polynucleotide 5'-hydroxyl-kinase GRC3/NOL9